MNIEREMIRAVALGAAKELDMAISRDRSKREENLLGWFEEMASDEDRGIFDAVRQAMIDHDFGLVEAMEYVKAGQEATEDLEYEIIVARPLRDVVKSIGLTHREDDGHDTGVAMSVEFDTYGSIADEILAGAIYYGADLELVVRRIR